MVNYISATKAEGDKEASVNLAAAARTMAESPGAMQLRTLQTIDGLGASASNTVVIAVPVELMDVCAQLDRSLGIGRTSVAELGPAPRNDRIVCSELKVALGCEARGKHHHIDITVVDPGSARSMRRIGPESLDLFSKWLVLLHARRLR